MPERLRERVQPLTVELSESGGDWSDLGEEAACIFEAADAVARAIALPARGASVSIALASDDEVAALNAAFRGKPKPTNVLSFPAGRGAMVGFLGDIALASETVRREATEQDIPFAHHVQHLVVHGLLHLLGYDHETDGDAERMEDLETSILAGLGVQDPHANQQLAKAVKE